MTIEHDAFVLLGAPMHNRELTPRAESRPDPLAVTSPHPHPSEALLVEITNTIGWPTPFLRTMCGFCSRELEYPVRRITKATFRVAHGAKYAGRADLNAHAIRVRINPLNAYPLAAPRQRGLPDLEHADAVELLIRITAHEIAHLERWDRFAQEWWRVGRRDVTRERDTEQLARMVLARFRRDRAELLAAWGESGPGPVWRPGMIHRLSCRRCGATWDRPRRPRQADRHACLECFPSWEAARAAGEFLVSKRIPEEPTGDAAARGRPAAARRAPKG